MKDSRYPLEAAHVRLVNRSKKVTGDKGIRFSQYSLITINVLILGLIITLQFLGADRSTPLWIGVATAIGCLIIAVAQLRFMGFQWSAAPMVYLIYMAAYHLLFVTPYTFANLFVDASSPLRFGDSISWWIVDWVYSPGAQMAVFLVATACIGFAVGSSLATSPVAKTSAADNQFDRGDVVLYRVGGALQIISIFLFLNSLNSGGGISVLAEDYQTLRENVMAGSMFTQATFLLGVGTILALAGAPKRSWYWPFIVFAIAAIPLFLTGNRGEVLYPLLTLAVMLYRKGIRLRRSVVLVGIVAVFMLVPIVFQIRSVGLGRVSLQDLSFEIERALIDLGFSLRPVATVANWIDSGDAYLLGGSFWLPFERALAQLLPFFWERGSLYFDLRFVAYQAYARTGAPMGFSVIAEAFYNFSFWGAPLVLGIIGLVLGWLHWRSTTPIRLALLGVVLFPLVNQVRNSFIFVPGQIFLGLGLLLVVSQWPRKPIRRRSSLSVGPFK